MDTTHIQEHLDNARAHAIPQLIAHALMHPSGGQAMTSRFASLMVGYLYSRGYAFHGPDMPVGGVGVCACEHACDHAREHEHVHGCECARG